MTRWMIKSIRLEDILFQNRHGKIPSCNTFHLITNVYLYTPEGNAPPKNILKSSSADMSPGEKNIHVIIEYRYCCF